MNEEDELRRAAKAKGLLENQVFKDACSEIEGAILAGIRRSAFKDAELREKLCQQYTILHSIQDQLRTYVETGELVEEAIRRRTVTEKIKGAFDALVN